MPDFMAGRHEALIEALDARLCRVETGVEGMNDKLDGVIVRLAEKRGERRAVVYVAGVVGTLVSLIFTVLARMWHS